MSKRFARIAVALFVVGFAAMVLRTRSSAGEEMPAGQGGVQSQDDTQVLRLNGSRVRGHLAQDDRFLALQDDPDVIRISAVGDVMIGSTYPDSSRLPPNDGADLLKAFSPVLQDADITFGNLEGPLLEGGISTKCGPPKADGTAKPNCFAFRVPPRYGQYLQDAGFTVMSLANNHAGDFGDEGRTSTRRILDGLGIQHAGSDREKFATTILTVKGKRIGFAGFAHNNIVPNVNELDAAQRIVKKLKSQVDLVVVSFHGGAEGNAHQHVPYETEMYVGEKRGDLRAFTHAVIDAGADLVLGHGPHVMRGMEVYQGHLIAYSMGNFCTYGWFGLEDATALTGVFQITIGTDGQFRSGRLVPGMQIKPGGPVPDPTGAAIPVVRALSVADFGVNAVVMADDGTFLPPGATAGAATGELR